MIALNAIHGCTVGFFINQFEKNIVLLLIGTIGNITHDQEKIAFTEYEAAQAKGVGRRVALRPDWENVKLSFMEEIVYAKFSQNEQLKQMLLATKEAVLKEGNTWNDVFWGVSLKTGRGENNLGKILMRVREKLRRESELKL